MKVFVTGGTGFVGSHIVRLLLRKGHEVVMLVRSGSIARAPTHRNARIVIGDVLDSDLASAMKGCDAIIHLVGIIRERRGITFERLHVDASNNVIRAAKKAKIKRLLHMSALGTRVRAYSEYHKTKYLGEMAVEASRLDWTIFRPSLIFGDCDLSINMFASMMRRIPVFPIFGRPSALIRPVFVDDVAAAYVNALARKSSIHRAFNLCGPNVYTYRELFRAIGRLVGKSVWCPRVPYALGWLMSTLLGWIPSFPMTKDQFIMINESNSCLDSVVKKTSKSLGLKLRTLEKEFPKYSR